MTDLDDRAVRTATAPVPRTAFLPAADPTAPPFAGSGKTAPDDAPTDTAAGRFAATNPAAVSHPALDDTAAWDRYADRVLDARHRSRRAPVVATLQIVERRRIADRLGHRGVDELLAQLAWLVDGDLEPDDRLGPDGHGGLRLLLRHTSPHQVARRLDRIVSRLTRREFHVGGEPVRVTPVVGWTTADDGVGEADEDVSDDAADTATERDEKARRLERMSTRAREAADAAAAQLDLVPRRWTPELAPAAAEAEPKGFLGFLRTPKFLESLRTPVQVLATFVLGIGLPLAVLVGALQFGIDLGTPAYFFVVASLVFTATTIWVEGFRALSPDTPPEAPAGPYPAAVAIIPAYLPNEAATIMETVRHFQRQDYPGELSIVVAYNTPRRLPVEAELAAAAADDPRLTVIDVPFSTSKAQNVNAALQVADGEITGIFDADHQPRRDAFTRAWRWISHGADVVQGHCVVRNGSASMVARTVAVEFESIYAVSHPGRASLHGFGLFGGSNGFWRTSVLHATRMRAEMLTEDIDSSIRAVLDGRKCVYDPGLLSYELAPATLSALWHQRIRWAQGWFQVSRRHLDAAVRSPRLSARNKIGMAFLLGWRELYPWIALMIIPVVAFQAWKAGGVTNLDFLVPSLLLATIYTTAVGPGQTLFAWRLAAPEVKKHPRWFLGYLFVASLGYSELRNVIARVAQLKELTGERRWVITPRDTDASPEDAAAGATAIDGATAADGAGTAERTVDEKVLVDRDTAEGLVVGTETRTVTVPAQQEVVR
ncbi:glycosyltransferase [Pseudonocardia phyllosphaerae]|uniref:glycosyltransferase n=1 Tax=Pseudonocardia phyllosphaerae TaxID=3390502 RepID=UPI00397D96BF